MQPEDAPDLDLVVMTGDIVGSSRMSPGELDAVMDALRRASFEVARQWGDGDPRFTRFRGDGWQCIGPTPERSLRAALLMRAYVRQLGGARDTRISVAIGPGFLPAEPSLAAASGPVFALSGHGLDNMPHVRRFALAWTEPPEDAELLAGDLRPRGRGVAPLDPAAGRGFRLAAGLPDPPEPGGACPRRSASGNRSSPAISPPGATGRCARRFRFWRAARDRRTWPFITPSEGCKSENIP